MKIKSKVVKSTLNNKDILDTFQEILGTSETNACLPIAHPKYVKMQINTGRFLKLLHMFHESVALSKFPDIKEYLYKYIESLDKNFVATFNAPDLEQYLTKSEETLSGHNYNVISKEIKTEFSISFSNMKKSNIVNIIIVTCKNLIASKKHYENKDKLSDHFLTKSAGNLFSPLPELSQLNFKRIYIDDILDSNDRTFILIFISKLYEISYQVYQILSSPDVDVNDFVNIIVANIDTVKKQIPRCNEAFSKIVESIDILKDNFDGYYKDFMSCNNPAIIMENFVLDVSKNTKATPKITSQFRRIIAYYRNIASKHSNDPRLQTLFSHVDKNFDALDKCQKGDEYVEPTENDEEEEAEELDVEAESTNNNEQKEPQENPQEELQEEQEQEEQEEPEPELEKA
jgi:hypothetical protein